jgi:type II secretion system protein N
MSPDRFRTIRKVVGLGLFGLLVFLVAFMMAFPYDRVKDQIVSIAAAQGMDMEVGSAGPTFGIGVVLKDVTLRTRPDPGKKANLIPIERAAIQVSPLAQLRGEFAYNLDVKALDGRIQADEAAEKTRSRTRLRTTELSLAQLPGVKDAINLPLGGRLDVNLDLTKPNHRNGEATGSLSWTCAGCSVGDGKEKLKIASNPLLAEGMSFPRMSLGDLVGKITFQKGVGRLQGVQARSPDGELFVEGEVRLADPVGYSYLDLYVRFKLSEALLRRADKLQILLQLAETMGKRSDGFYGFRLTGSFARLNSVQWMKASPFPAAGPGFGSRAEAPGTDRPQRANPMALRRDPGPPGPDLGSRATLSAAAAAILDRPGGPTVVDPRAAGANTPRYATQPGAPPPAE